MEHRGRPRASQSIDPVEEARVRASLFETADRIRADMESMLPSTRMLVLAYVRARLDDERRDFALQRRVVPSPLARIAQHAYGISVAWMPACWAIPLTPCQPATEPAGSAPVEVRP